MKTLPTSQEFAAALAADRLNRYIADLGALLSRATRLGFRDEAREIELEIQNRTAGVAITCDSLSGYTALARLQMSMRRDLAIVARAAGRAPLVTPNALPLLVRVKAWFQRDTTTAISQTVSALPGLSLNSSGC